MLALILMIWQLYSTPLTPETFYNVSSSLNELKGNILTTDSPLVSFTLKKSVNKILMFNLTDPCESIKKNNINWVFFSTREDWFKENEKFYLQKMNICTTKRKEIDFGFEKYYILKTN